MHHIIIGHIGCSQCRKMHITELLEVCMHAFTHPLLLHSTAEEEEGFLGTSMQW
jgi:hypothetical protein